MDGEMSRGCVPGGVGRAMDGGETTMDDVPGG